MLQTMGGNPKDFNKLDLKRLPKSMLCNRQDSITK